MMPSVPRPRRAIEIEVRIGADEWKEVRRALDCIADDLDEERTGAISIASGAPGFGYSLIGSRDDSITHDSYHEALLRWRGDVLIALPLLDMVKP